MQELAKTVLMTLIAQDQMLATAESCTGGMIAAAITDIAGSSAAFDRGFVTYSNAAKEGMLGVLASSLDKHGAVSAAVAEEMATGAIRHSDATIAVSCTGIAGPDGGTVDKAVGLVHIGIALAGQPSFSYEHHFVGDRASVRRQTVAQALRHIQEHLS